MYLEMQTDWSSEEGARKLAVHIAHYWKGRGYPSITTGVVKTNAIAPAYGREAGKYVIKPMPVFTVVTNIGPNGYPPAPS